MLVAGFMAALGAAETLEIPKLACDGKSGSVLAAAVPWQSGFYRLGTAEKALVQTRYKIFHDNSNLYIGIEADEPATGSMLRTNRRHDDARIWMDDSIELNFARRGDDKRLFKIMVNTEGVVADFSGLDDNTGLNNFVMDGSFESHVKVLSHTISKDRWTLELAIPLGAFNDGWQGGLPELTLLLGRTRCAGRTAENKAVMEHTASVKTAVTAFGDVQAFASLLLKEFDGREFQWRLNDTAVQTRRNPDGNFCEVTGSLVNSGNAFRIYRLRAVLVDRNGEVATEKELAGRGEPGKLSSFRFVLPLKNFGEYHLRLEARNGHNELICERSKNVMLDYQPVIIRFTTPWYRDNIYATMPKIDRIEAEIALSENIGQPLDVTLTGPNLRKTQRIEKAQLLNKVTFPFVNMPDGDYYLVSGGAKKRFRKLPFSPGEVWLDREGIIHIEGKRRLPLGIFGLPRQKKFAGVSFDFNFVSPFRSPEAAKAYLDGCEAAGRPAVIYPYHTFPKNYTYEWVDFTHADQQKSAINDVQKEHLRRFVEIVRRHRGFMAYYLTDEPEGRDENPLWFQSVSEFLSEVDPYHPTVGNHYGTDGMRRYINSSDIICGDCYWDFFRDNRNAMPAISSFQFMKTGDSLRPGPWLVIQAFDWGHTNRFGGKSRAPTFDEMRTQIYLGLLGNAKAISLFSYSTTGGAFSNQLRIGDQYVLEEPAALAEFLLARTDMDAVKAEVNGRKMESFPAGVKRDQGRFVIIAVNPEYRKCDVKFTTNFDLPVTLAVSGEKRAVKTAGRSFFDHFEPLETHLYLSDALIADSIDLAAVRAAIADADRARKKPGNLAAAGELGRAEIVDYNQGIVPAGVPKITSSSSAPGHANEQFGYEYFLQDGICETLPESVWMGWSPRPEDPAPWVEIDFGKPQTISRVKVYTILRAKDARSPLEACHVEVWEKHAWRKVAAIENNRDAVREMSFKPVETSKIRLVLDKIDWRQIGARLLSEIEVMQ